MDPFKNSECSSLPEQGRFVLTVNREQIIRSQSILSLPFKGLNLLYVDSHYWSPFYWLIVYPKRTVTFVRPLNLYRIIHTYLESLVIAPSSPVHPGSTSVVFLQIRPFDSCCVSGSSQVHIQSSPSFFSRSPLDVVSHSSLQPFHYPQS